MKQLTLLISVALLAASCLCTKKPRVIPDPYRDDTELTDANGKPVNMPMSWLPDSVLLGDDYQRVINEESMMESASASLCAAKEPVLFNTYTGRSVYRFYRGGGLQVPIILSLWRKKNTVGITVKMLNRQPETFTLKKLYFADGTPVNKHQEDRTLVIRSAKIAFEKTFPLTLRDWTEFEERLLEDKFWYREPFVYKFTGATDMPIAFLEAHLPNNYHVSRSLPALDFLIRKSGMQKYFGHWETNVR